MQHSQHKANYTFNLPSLNYIGKYNNLYKFVALLSVMSFIPALFLPHIGEEGVYTISSMEMLFNQDFFNVTIYGGAYPRPPLYNWAIIGIASLFKPPQFLISARLVSILSTLMTAAFTSWLTNKLWRQRFLNLLTVAVFLSGDTLLRRGWLAYSDPIFSLFAFASMALFWLAVVEQRYIWLLISVFCLFFGFLAKVHTIYIFYALTGVVLIWRYPSNWKFIFSWQAGAIYFLALLLPWLWTNYVSHSGRVASTIVDATHILALGSLRDYLLKLFCYPFELLFRTLPLSLLAVYAIFKQKIKLKFDNSWLVAIAIVGLNFCPYWLAPTSHIRYLQPLYPFIALIIAYIIYQGGEALLRRSLQLLAVCCILNFALMLFWYPYDQTVRKGNARAIAKDVLQIAGNAPLYTNDSGAGGLRISAEINDMIYPAPPLSYIGKKYNGYVLVNLPTDVPGILVATYKMGGITVYLKCNGEYCRK